MPRPQQQQPQATPAAATATNSSSGTSTHAAINTGSSSSNVAVGSQTPLQSGNSRGASTKSAQTEVADTQQSQQQQHQQQASNTPKQTAILQSGSAHGHGQTHSSSSSTSNTLDAVRHQSDLSASMIDAYATGTSVFLDASNGQDTDAAGDTNNRLNDATAKTNNSDLPVPPLSGKAGGTDSSASGSGTH